MSSFIFYEGGPERELLIDRLGRMRDIETEPDGNIYLSLEHAGGACIVRLVPIK